MFAIVVVTMLAHAFVVAKGVAFFVEGSCRRDAEKHIIASIAVGSLIFIVFQTWIMMYKPDIILRNEDIYSPWLAYNFFTSVLHMCLAAVLTKQRSERVGHKS